MGEPALDTYSVEDYISIEATSDTRLEYHNGYIVAMAGGSPLHGALQINVGASIQNSLKTTAKSCRVHSSDVKVSILPNNRRYYPDLSVVCGSIMRDLKEPNAITNPVLIVEVLSESTELLDRGAKFAAYRQLETLKEYMLVSQERVLVELYSRNADESWNYKSYTSRDQSIYFVHLGIEMAVSDVYYGLEEIREELF